MVERERTALNARCAARRGVRQYRRRTFDEFVFDVIRIAQRAARARGA